MSKFLHNHLPNDSHEYTEFSRLIYAAVICLCWGHPGFLFRYRKQARVATPKGEGCEAPVPDPEGGIGMGNMTSAGGEAPPDPQGKTETVKTATSEGEAPVPDPQDGIERAEIVTPCGQVLQRDPQGGVEVVKNVNPEQ